MRRRWSRLALAALALPAAISAAPALAQTQPRPYPPMEARSPEMRERLFDGRMAMIRESLRLDARQLAMWAPVEAQLRAAFAARQKARAEREARLESGDRAALAPPDRLERASQRAVERADRLKALAEAFRPFYAALGEDQKAIAGVVLRPVWNDRGPHGRRWMRRAAAPEQP